MAAKKTAKVGRHHYEVLGVARASKPEEVKEAWRRLARQQHPDANIGAEEATARFAELSGAYACLSDEKAKAVYDAGLAIGTNPCGRCEGDGLVYKQKGFTAREHSVCPDCRGSGRTR